MKEFEIISKLLRPLSGKDSGELADDCAFFGGFCITKDILVAGVHFFVTDAPFNLARKSLRVNLSDLAASGAEPFGFMLGLALPKGMPDSWLGEFTRGLKSDIKKYNFQLLGGDTVFHNGALIISVTAIGKTKKPVLRSGARAGDNIFISGKIGDGWLGLQAKLRGENSQKYELPEPRVDLIPAIRKNATSCIDISDGLLADLGHICEESKLGAEINSKAIPVSDSKADIMKLITGGDDYELLFTSAKPQIKGCYKIGRITKAKGIKLDSKKVTARGYEHNNY